MIPVSVTRTIPHELPARQDPGPCVCTHHSSAATPNTPSRRKRDLPSKYHVAPPNSRGKRPRANVNTSTPLEKQQPPWIHSHSRCPSLKSFLVLPHPRPHSRYTSRQAAASRGWIARSWLRSAATPRAHSFPILDNSRPLPSCLASTVHTHSPNGYRLPATGNPSHVVPSITPGPSSLCELVQGPSCPGNPAAPFSHVPS